MNVLHIITSPRPAEESISKQLAFRFFGALMGKYPDALVDNVDLYQAKPPFASNEFMRGVWKPAMEPGYEPTRGEETAANFSNNNAPILADADVLVITTPVWINSMPAILKAWLDQVIVPGALFDVTPDGIVPKHHIKSVVLIVSSADVYKEEDPADGLTPAIRAIFNYIGIDDIRTVWADGQNADRFPDAAERLEMAMEAAEELAEEIIEG